jgi:hypothetical protein
MSHRNGIAGGEQLACPAGVASPTSPATRRQESRFPWRTSLRAILFASVLSVALSGAALADRSVAGDWHANLGDGIGIDMNIAPDGRWSSETVQHDHVVRQMKGEYRQTHGKRDAGTLFFTPTQSSGGKAQRETDTYRLSDNGNTMRLTSEGDTMTFERRQQH